MTRHKARALGVAGVLGLLLPAAAACGIQPTGITALGPAPAAVEASPAASLDASAGTAQYLLYFYQNNQLAPVMRAAKGDVTETVVLDALLGGPSVSEQSAGYTSALPGKLTATIRADGLLGAYSLNQPLGLRAKAEFICTMQYYDQTISVGIQVVDSNVNWNACSDTTNQYIPMQGDQTKVPTVTGPGVG